MKTSQNWTSIFKPMWFLGMFILGLIVGQILYVKPKSTCTPMAILGVAVESDSAFAQVMGGGIFEYDWNTSKWTPANKPLDFRETATISDEDSQEVKNLHAGYLFSTKGSQTLIQIWDTPHHSTDTQICQP